MESTFIIIILRVKFKICFISNSQLSIHIKRTNMTLSGLGKAQLKELITFMKSVHCNVSIWLRVWLSSRLTASRHVTIKNSTRGDSRKQNFIYEGSELKSFHYCMMLFRLYYNENQFSNKLDRNIPFSYTILIREHKSFH